MKEPQLDKEIDEQETNAFSLDKDQIKKPSDFFLPENPIENKTSNFDEDIDSELHASECVEEIASDCNTKMNIVSSGIELDQEKDSFEEIGSDCNTKMDIVPSGVELDQEKDKFEEKMLPELQVMEDTEAEENNVPIMVEIDHLEPEMSHEKNVNFEIEESTSTDVECCENAYERKKEMSFETFIEPTEEIVDSDTPIQFDFNETIENTQKDLFETTNEEHCEIKEECEQNETEFQSSDNVEMEILDHIIVGKLEVSNNEFKNDSGEDYKIEAKTLTEEIENDTVDFEELNTFEATNDFQEQKMQLEMATDLDKSEEMSKELNVNDNLISTKNIDTLGDTEIEKDDLQAPHEPEEDIKVTEEVPQTLSTEKLEETVINSFENQAEKIENVFTISATVENLNMDAKVMENQETLIDDIPGDVTEQRFNVEIPNTQDTENIDTFSDIEHNQEVQIESDIKEELISDNLIVDAIPDDDNDLGKCVEAQQDEMNIFSKPIAEINQEEICAEQVIGDAKMCVSDKPKVESYAEQKIETELESKTFEVATVETKEETLPDIMVETNALMSEVNTESNATSSTKVATDATSIETTNDYQPPSADNNTNDSDSSIPKQTEDSFQSVSSETEDIKDNDKSKDTLEVADSNENLSNIEKTEEKLTITDDQKVIETVPVENQDFKEEVKEEKEKIPVEMEVKEEKGNIPVEVEAQEEKEKIIVEVEAQEEKEKIPVEEVTTVTVAASAAAVAAAAVTKTAVNSVKKSPKPPTSLALLKTTPKAAGKSALAPSAKPTATKPRVPVGSTAAKAGAPKTTTRPSSATQSTAKPSTIGVSRSTPRPASARPLTAKTTTVNSRVTRSLQPDSKPTGRSTPSTTSSTPTPRPTALRMKITPRETSTSRLRAASAARVKAEQKVTTPLSKPQTPTARTPISSRITPTSKTPPKRTPTKPTSASASSKELANTPFAKRQARLRAKSTDKKTTKEESAMINGTNGHTEVKTSEE